MTSPLPYTKIPETILLVEDDPGIATLAQRHLERAGFQVLSASMTHAAMTHIMHDRVALVVLDYHLPGTTGIDLYARMKAAGRDLPAIIVTGNPDETLTLRALRSGFSDVLLKSDHFLEYLPEAVTRILTQKKTQYALAYSEARLSALLGAAMDPIITIDRQEQITLFNRAAETTFVCPCSEALGQTIRRFIPEGLPEILPSSLGPTLPKRCEVRCIRTDGRVFPAEVVRSRVHVIGETFDTLIVRDITERKEAEVRLRSLAYYDALTNLPNRALFFDRMTQVLAGASRTGGGGALFFVDLDGFKSINDRMGHALGDALLRVIADRLTGMIRPADTVCRFGGDEFLILLPQVTETTDAMAVANKVVDIVAAPITLRGIPLQVTASIGIARYSANGADIDTLIRHADAAMYRAKTSGKNRVCFYQDEGAYDTVFAQRTLENDLNAALKRDAFLLYYQPQVDMRTGRVCGMEALLRWSRPDGVALPSTFMTAAEESGLIIPIGEWVFWEACRQQAVWRKCGFAAGPTSVNLSHRQIVWPDLTDRLNTLLKTTHCDAGSLRVEVTEDAVRRNASAVDRAIDGLHDIGVGVVIDRFGSGYSSFHRLQSLRPSAVKIDTVFVREITTNPAAKDTVEAIVGMAHGLKITCSANGVETEEQRAALAALSCDVAQGEWFSRPLSAIACSDRFSEDAFSWTPFVSQSL